MELKFELDKDDLLKFHRFHFWFAPNNKKLRLRTRLGLAIPLFIMPYVFSNNPISFTTNYGINTLVIGFSLGLSAWFMAKSFTLESIERRLNKVLKEGKNQDILGEYNFIFGNNEIEINTPNTTTKFNVSTIEKILEDNEYYYIYINILSAYIIPKKALKNANELEKLEKILNNYHSKNKLI